MYSLLIVRVSPTTAVLILVPPNMLSVSAVLSATAVPSSETTFLNILKGATAVEPLSVLVTVNVKS